MNTFRRHRTSGFTLIEIAFVLIILTLLLGAILVPLGSAFEQSQRKTVKAQLEEINEALIGFSIVNERLPCPADENSNGAEVFADQLTGECEVFHGFVPSATLGLLGEVNEDGLLLDVWNNPIRYSVTNQFNNGLFYFTVQGGMQAEGMQNLTPNLLICLTASAGSTCGAGNIRVNQVPSIVYSMGKDWAAFTSNAQLENAGDTVDANLNYSSTLNGSRSYPIQSDNVFVATSFNQVAGNEFDDIVIWLSENILYTRLIQAGVLP